MDEQFARQLRQGLYGTSNRAIGGLLGMPVDMTNYALSLLGTNINKPIGGSEWLNEMMSRYGMVPEERYPLAERMSLLAMTPTPVVKRIP